MGRCNEFGLQIHDGCGHAMVAGDTACNCPECGVECRGRFAACPDVWARGPQSLPPDPEPAAGARWATAVVYGSDQRSLSSATSGRTRPVVTADPEPEPPLAVFQPAATAVTGQAATSAAARQWLDGVFSALYEELRSLRTTVDQQQAAMASMADLISRIGREQAAASGPPPLVLDAEALLREVAEALPCLIDEAVSRAVETTHERTSAVVDEAVNRAVEATEPRVAATVGEVVTQAILTSEGLAEMVGDAVNRAVQANEERSIAAWARPVTAALAATEKRTAAPFDRT